LGREVLGFRGERRRNSAGQVWLTGISPMVWRRVLVPANFTLRELHGVIQVVMGWEGIHLYNFHLRAEHYGSWELSASSPDVTLTALRLRKGARFIYEYDLNIPWRHEVQAGTLFVTDGGARKCYGRHIDFADPDGHDAHPVHG
jgi:hypothetical protein